MRHSSHFEGTFKTRFVFTISKYIILHIWSTTLEKILETSRHLHFFDIKLHYANVFIFYLILRNIWHAKHKYGQSSFLFLKNTSCFFRIIKHILRTINSTKYKKCRKYAMQGENYEFYMKYRASLRPFSRNILNSHGSQIVE